jgi:hypothetical protein
VNKLIQADVQILKRIQMEMVYLMISIYVLTRLVVNKLVQMAVHCQIGHLKIHGCVQMDKDRGSKISMEMGMDILQIQTV